MSHPGMNIRKRKHKLKRGVESAEGINSREQGWDLSTQQSALMGIPHGIRYVSLVAPVRTTGVPSLCTWG